MDLKVGGSEWLQNGSEWHCLLHQSSQEPTEIGQNLTFAIFIIDKIIPNMHL